MYPWLRLGPFAISTYSLMFLLAYTVGGLLTYYEAKRLVTLGVLLIVVESLHKFMLALLCHKPRSVLYFI